MAFHPPGAGAMSMAAISIANPRNAWVEPHPEETSTGKQVLQAAAANLKKSGREILARTSTSSRLESLKTRRSVSGEGEEGDSSGRPASRLSVLMGKSNGGNARERERERERELKGGGGGGGEREGGEGRKVTTTTPGKKTASFWGKAYTSFRGNRHHYTTALATGTQSPESGARSDDDVEGLPEPSRGVEGGGGGGGGDGYPRIPSRHSSLPAPPALPLLSFPSAIAMPPRAPSATASFSSRDRDEYSGEEAEVAGQGGEEVARVARVVRARLTTVGDGGDGGGGGGGGVNLR